MEITVSYLGMHKWEPDIYIVFSCTGPSFAVKLWTGKGQKITSFKINILLKQVTYRFKN